MMFLRVELNNTLTIKEYMKIVKKNLLIKEHVKCSGGFPAYSGIIGHPFRSNVDTHSGHIWTHDLSYIATHFRGLRWSCACGIPKDFEQVFLKN